MGLLDRLLGRNEDGVEACDHEWRPRRSPEGSTEFTEYKLRQGPDGTAVHITQTEAHVPQCSECDRLDLSGFEERVTGEWVYDPAAPGAYDGPVDVEHLRELYGGRVE